MEDFINYLLKEYQLPNEVVCHKVTCNHSSKSKIDKKSKGSAPGTKCHVPVTNNIITVKIECFDKDHNLICYQNERFVDGEIYRPKTRKLVNISPQELNNRFGKAKGQICRNIENELMGKVKSLNEDLSSLKQYCGNESSIIPNEFINEPKVTKPQSGKGKAQEEESKTKFEF